MASVKDNSALRYQNDNFRVYSDFSYVSTEQLLHIMQIGQTTR